MVTGSCLVGHALTPDRDVTHLQCSYCVNPSSYLVHVVDAVFLKRTRPRAERADGQPLARLTPGFCP